MTRESLARKFRPAGFEQPEGSRREYTKPRPELHEAFYKWIGELSEHVSSWKEFDDQYKKAIEYIKTIGEIPVKEANSLLVDFKPKTETQGEAGLFISACYTRSPEEVIVFDVDAPEIDFIGYRTEKNIFNTGSVGKRFACWSPGIVVNNGKAGDPFAANSSGLFVNNGECETFFNSPWSSGTRIAVEEPSYALAVKDWLFWTEDLDEIPELKKYLKEISEATKDVKNEESAKMFLEMYGPEPKERIEKEIKEMLKRKIGSDAACLKDD